MNVKKISAMTGIAAMSLAFATTSVAQPLVNGGFETGDTTGWTLLGGTASASSTYAHSGTYSLLIDSTGAGAWSSPQASQLFPAAPGLEYNFNGWMLQSANDPITDASFGLLKIVFKDINGADLVPASASVGIINNSFPGIESQPFLNSGSLTDTWISSAAQGVAPAGTVSVTFFLLNVNQGIDPGGMYFDDISATLVPEPTTFALAGLGAAALLIFRRRS